MQECIAYAANCIAKGLASGASHLTRALGSPSGSGRLRSGTGQHRCTLLVYQLKRYAPSFIIWAACKHPYVNKVHVTHANYAKEMCPSKGELACCMTGQLAKGLATKPVILSAFLIMHHSQSL